MAIKFHCPHCQQLLGISSTKAGMIVDCPACGRSVHVPDEGGAATRMAPASRSSDHPSLLIALQELSALGTPTESVSEPPAISKVAPRARKLPVARTTSASSRFSLLILMVMLSVFAAGLFLGTFWKSSSHPGAATADPQSAVAPVAAIPLPAARERQLKGVVRFIDASGNSAADTGAVVLLLPAENTTPLRLDARPLRESTDSKARQAIEAALRILGGSLHQADDTGRWAANVPSNAALTMVVISRHRSRTANQPVPADILELLSQWFDSPLHITGRLSVKQSLVPATSSGTNSQPTQLDVEFSSKE